MIDSLPYHDASATDSSLDTVVMQLIQLEMACGAQRAGSRAEEEVLLFKNNPLLAAEMLRIESSYSTTTTTTTTTTTPSIHKLNALDTARLRMPYPLPSSSSTDGEENEEAVAAWQLAVNNSLAQLHHQHTRILNLELVAAFGANQWKYANYMADWAVATLAGSDNQLHGRRIDADELGDRSSAEAVKQAIVALNRKRKIQQIQGGEELSRLEAKRRDLLTRSLRVEEANVLLQAEVDKLKLQRQ